MAELSPRQREVLGLVAAGRTSKEIAGDLGISESTVNWHISNVFGRLGASSRAEAVALAMRDDAARPDAVATSHRPSWRPPAPLLSVALAVAVTLILGLLGGALLAGWQLPTSLSPSASAAPSRPDPRSPDPTAPGRSSAAPATGVPATPTAPPPPSPSIDQVAPVLPALPTVLPLTLPTVLPLTLPTAVPLPLPPAPLPADLPSLTGR